MPIRRFRAPGTSSPAAFEAVLLTDPQSRTPNATGIVIPFSVLEVFGTRGRVPVRGTVNGFAFRSSLAPYGGKHYMAVNRQMREGAKAQARERRLSKAMAALAGAAAGKRK